MYLKGTFRVDNEGTYTIEFNTGGNSGNLDIGWNAVLNNNNEPVLIQQGQISDENIYPYFSLLCPEFYYNNNYIASFIELFDYVCNETLDSGGNLNDWDAEGIGNPGHYPCSGYQITPDSFFPNVTHQSTENWKDYSCKCNYSGTYRDDLYFKKFDHNSYCQTRYVLIALENYSDDINFSFNNDFILFYVSKGKPNDTDYKNLLDKMFTSGEHNFKLINNYIHHNGGNNKHTSKIPSTVDVNLNVIQNEKIFSKNPEELYYSIFESYYEGLTYADYLFGNIKFGEWYPSKDITLHDYKDSMILELTFKNGDTNFENQKLNINYSQKISYCHHNLYKPYFKTKSIYHPAKVHFDYNKDEWIENSPSYYEDEYKYWYDNDFNWETNKTYSKIISR